jgi:hypothetical protein
MALGKPDPRFTHSKRARSSFRLALKISLVVVGVLWAIFVIDAVFGLRLGRFGLRPGSVPGLAGILFAPLLHGSVQHLLSNTIPLLISLTATLYLYPTSALRVIPLIWLGSGGLAWLIGRPSLHFAAPGHALGIGLPDGRFSVWVHGLGRAADPAQHVLGDASFRRADRRVTGFRLPQVGSGAPGAL